eukprot:TRINITY_DN1385_c0_g1_i1.p1 TRINITY_DN1385_c0_g1~~TRINITY_DN1385_c0_g1_i1.p1  ORF type:complete len:146 (+),score=22.01 TRINITY_DN1385_c0_g1_i1:144-581(+)
MASINTLGKNDINNNLEDEINETTSLLSDLLESYSQVFEQNISIPDDSQAYTYEPNDKTSIHSDQELIRRQQIRDSMIIQAENLDIVFNTLESIENDLDDIDKILEDVLIVDSKDSLRIYVQIRDVLETTKEKPKYIPKRTTHLF